MYLHFVCSCVHCSEIIQTRIIAFFVIRNHGASSSVVYGVACTYAYACFTDLRVLHDSRRNHVEIENFESYRKKKIRSLLLGNQFKYEFSFLIYRHCRRMTSAEVFVTYRHWLAIASRPRSI